MADLGKEFLNTIKKSDERKTQPFDAVGIVTRVKDGIAYVHFAGGVDETPVKMTINAQAGDEVQVRVADGRAWLVGNATSPPTDDAQARRAINLGKQANEAAVRATKDAMVAHEAAESASKSAREAKETTDEINAYAETAGKTITQILNDGETAGTAAQQAKSAADKAVKDLSQVENVVGVINWVAEHGEMISQEGGTFDPAKVYFIVDPNGDYHIGNTHYSIVAEPKAEDIDDYYILNINESVQNYVMTHVFVDEEGLWLIPEENATVQTSSKKILIAVGGNSHTYSDAGTYIIDRVDNTDQIVAKFAANETIIGDSTRGSGKPRVVINSNGTNITDGLRSFAISRDGIDWGEYGNTPLFRVKEGYLEYRTEGLKSAGLRVDYFGGSRGAGMIFASERGSDPYLKGASAEDYSFALGGSVMVYDVQTLEWKEIITSATGEHSFAQGSGAKATGRCSSSQGSGTTASGDYSHACNSWTVAEYSSQTVIGKLNDNKSNNAFEIGNGTDDQNRSNAFEVDWDGNMTAGGSVEDGSGNVLSNKADQSSVPTATSQLTNDSGFLAEDANGDLSITRNIDAGGDVTPSGQVKTSFKSSVAMGSYGSAQTSIPNFVDEVRYSSGCAGSIEIGTAYTKDGVTIPVGWYNFMYMPHRTGGKNGLVDPAATDNVEYGNLLLFGFGSGSGRYDITIDGGVISKLAKLITSSDIRKSPTTSTHTKNVGKIAANTYKNCETNTITPTAAQSGLIPVVSGWDVQGTGTSSCQIMGVYLSGNATSGYVGHVKVKNDSASQIGDVTIEIRVLWV